MGFISFLRRFNAADDFAGLKKAAEKHALSHDHRAYEQALMQYDDEVSFEESYSAVGFVGSGKGQHTLNSYRKLNFDGRMLFEKIYSIDSLDWRKCHYFYEQIHPRLNGSGICVPALLWRLCGNRLVVARFEFIDFSTVDSECYVEEVVRLTNSMASLGPVGADAPPEFQDLTQHFGFQRCFQKSVRVIEKAREKVGILTLMRKQCEALPRFVGHGDLSRPNMGGDGLVLDWDNFGFYPPGFDLALALVLKDDLLGEDELVSFARQGYEGVREYCTFDEFWFSLVFFYGVFLSARKAEHKIYCFGLLEPCLLALGREIVVID